MEKEPKKRRPGFQPGQSGNPAGKPKGTRSKALQALDAIGMEQGEAVVRALIAKALEGDVTAQKAIADRVWPVRKGGAPRPFDLPTGGGSVAAVDALLAQVADGTLTGDEAAAVAALVEARRRAVETEDLAERIAALEGRMTP